MAIRLPDSIAPVYRPFWDYKAPPIYRAIVRDFGNGEAEVLTHLVVRTPSIEQLRDSDACAAGIPVCQSWKDRRDRLAAESAPVSDREPEKNHERACRRAKQSVRWRIKGQSLDHMLTLSVRENITDRAAFKAYWAKFLRLIKEKNGGKDWPYVAAVETQERGALHLHVAVRGRQDVHKLRGLWWRALGSRVGWSKGVPYCLDGETLGNIDVRGPRRGMKWRSRSLAGYLSKYIGKEVDSVGKNERKYWAPTGWVCPKSVVFLQAQDLRSALIETADLFAAASGGFWGSPWKSPDWACLWVST